MDEVAVVTAFARHDAEVLACKRGADAPTYPGRWGGVSGRIEGGEDAVAAARRELHEEVGIDDAEIVRTADPLRVEAQLYDSVFVVHPALCDVPDRAIDRSDELDAVEWLPATTLLERDAVPELFEAYLRVAPTVQSVAADDEHGAATLSVRALEVLRDRAGLLASEGEDDLDELRYLGDRLREARPSMAVLRNRINRALATGGVSTVADAPGSPADAEGGTDTVGAADAADRADAAGDATPADVERAAIDGINRALAADAEAAMRAAGLLSGWHVLTLSRSRTVFDALAADTASAISIAESRPAREGIDVAETLAARATDRESAGTDAAPGAGTAPITVHTDAAIAHRLAVADVDAVFVGADAILPDGRVVNKTGTRGAAIAADREGIPVYVAAATDKVTTREQINLEAGHPSAVYDGDAPIDVANPTFDVTPEDAVAGVVTERGVLDGDEIAAVAEELRAFEPR